MRVHALSLGLLLTLQYLTATAQSLPAERPLYQPGDTWTYEFTNKRFAKAGCLYSLTVEKVTSANVYARLQYPDGCEVSITTSYQIPAQSLQKYDLNLNHYQFSTDPYPALDFPLRVGKKWSKQWNFKLNGWDYANTISGEVESIERIATPAGSFEAYRVRLVRDYLGTKTGAQTQAGRLEDTLWYSPEVKSFVRRTYVDNGWANITRELTTYRLH